jgi:hypothetical protein
MGEIRWKPVCSWREKNEQFPLRQVRDGGVGHQSYGFYRSDDAYGLGKLVHQCNRQLIHL